MAEPDPRVDANLVAAALDATRGRIRAKPEVFLVLGSGLDELARAVEEAVVIPFEEIPGFPRPGVEGHSGRLVSGVLEGRNVLIQAGRFHLYEGHPDPVVVGPVRLAAVLGARTVVLTNAAGGIGRDLEPGSIMLVEDHLNWMFRYPLTGPVQGSEERFPDMSRPFDPGIQETAMRLAREMAIPLHRGTYAGVLGPSYETPAEIRLLERLGAHAVGMSTVPETLAAGALGLRVAAFSLITNRAAGLAGEKLDHRDVLRVGQAAGRRLYALIRALLRELPGD